MRSTDDRLKEFTQQLLGTGLTLVDVLGMLSDELPEDAFPGEHPAAVLVEMLTGTLRPVVDAAGERAVREATALLAAAHERVIKDLRAAAELASDGDTPRRPGLR